MINFHLEVHHSEVGFYESSTKFKTHNNIIGQQSKLAIHVVILIIMQFVSIHISEIYKQENDQHCIF
jgi:hypothetical protein